MEQKNTRLRNVGFITFFFSGICAISSGVVVSLLQEQYGFAYGMTGTLLSLMSIGNLLAGFLIAMLPGRLGMKPSILLLTIGYAVGYAMMGLSGAVAVLALGFFLVGIAKGSVINTCTILVSDHSAYRTRGMNLMHSCYACGALLCPFFIAAAGRVSGSFAVLVLAVLGLLLWLVYMGTPFAEKGAGRKEVTDWGFLKSTRFWLLEGKDEGDEQTGHEGRAPHDGDGIGRQCTRDDAAALKAAPQGHGGHGRELHHLLHPAGAGPQSGCGHRAAVRLRLCDGGHEPHRRGQRGPDDQRDQYGHHAAGGGQRCHPDAVGHRHGGRGCGPCRRHDDQHHPLRGSGPLCHPRGTAAGRIKKTRRAAAHAAALLVIRCRGPLH